MNLCIRCNKNTRFQYRGKTYQLCAVCALKAFRTLLDWIEENSTPAEEQVTNAVGCIEYEEWCDG